MYELIPPSAFLVVSFASLVAQAQERAITEAEAVVAIYVEHRSLLSSEPPRLILSAWDDGRVVWSDDPVTGGPPYRGARIDPEAVTALLSAFEADGLFELDELEHARFGPDATFTTILLSSGGKRLRMRSWHELMESRGGVARKTGVVSTEEPRLHALRDEPADYLFYRFVWADIRARARELIPSDGDPVEGGVAEKDGRITWLEPRK